MGRRADMGKIKHLLKPDICRKARKVGDASRFVRVHHPDMMAPIEKEMIRETGCRLGRQGKRKK